MGGKWGQESKVTKEPANENELPQVFFLPQECGPCCSQVSSSVQTRVDGMQCKTKCSAAPFFPPRLKLPLQCRLMNHTEPAVSSTLWWRKWWTRDGWRRSQYKSLCSLPLSPSPCHQPPGLPMPIDLPMHPLPNWHRLLLYCYNLPPHPCRTCCKQCIFCIAHSAAIVPHCFPGQCDAIH